MPDLAQQLREVEIPGEAASRERAWRMLDAAYEERLGDRRRAPSIAPRMRWGAATVFAIVAPRS